MTKLRPSSGTPASPTIRSTGKQLASGLTRQIAALAVFATLGIVSIATSIPPALARGPQSVADVAEKLQDAVVNISTSQTLKSARHVPLPKVPKGSPFEKFFKDFFDQQNSPNKPKKINSLGSGFVIDASGLVVTNNHVIKDADEIIVKFNDGRKLKVVKVLGVDAKSDLALLKVEPKKPLKAVPFGNSTTMRVGDWVMAIGNPFGLGGTLTVGVISAVKRDINSGPYDEFIQTDAAINRGNSGGPLFNMDGEVIGVNTAIISPTGGSIGIGFAIPSNTARSVISQLEKFGEVRRGWLGVRIQTISDEIAESLGMSETSGALISSVTPNSPAAKAGLKSGDIILKFNGQKVASMRALPKLVARTAVDENVPVELLRKGVKKTLTVKIARLSDNKNPAAKKLVEKIEKKQWLLGVATSEMNDELRARYKIGRNVRGVVVTKVKPDSAASQNNIVPGNVIMEVTQEKVEVPDDIARRISYLRRNDKKSALLLLSNGKGELRFVAIPIDDDENGNSKKKQP